MMLTKRSRHLIHCVIIVIIMGIASRVFHTGFALCDKYLGDALYAVLAYLLFSLFWRKGTPRAKASLTLLLMLAIETFQLTLIPLRFRLSSSLFLELLSIVLGTKFAWLDILAYVVGILIFFLLESYPVQESRCQTV